MKKIWAEVLLVIGTIVFFGLNFILPESEKINEPVIEVVIPEPVLKFGFNVDSFFIANGKIRRNQNLSDILVKYGVDLVTIDKLARSSRDTFDVRRIKSGHNYYVFQTPDSLKNAQYFVYESSTTDYVVFELIDSLKTYKGRKEIEIRHKEVSGVIESSLWNSISEQGVNPVLSLDLSEIYAWTIDFFGIQKGDHYRVIYDEQFVDGKSVGIGAIYAAEFNHMGKDILAFRFFQNERYYYFDENGINLKKAFLKSPLRFSRISSRFSHSRMHPVLKIRRPHRGVDYAAPRGTPVLSIGQGNVIERGYQRGGGGNYLKIKHNSVYTTVYMHLSKFEKGIVTGARVEQGDVIGYVGATGLATGPHLDFRVYKNKQAVDPLKVESEPGDPVSEENIPAYNILKDSLKNRLLSLEL